MKKKFKFIILFVSIFLISSLFVVNSFADSFLPSSEYEVPIITDMQVYVSYSDNIVGDSVFAFSPIYGSRSLISQQHITNGFGTFNYSTAFDEDLDYPAFKTTLTQFSMQSVDSVYVDIYIPTMRYICGHDGDYWGDVYGGFGIYFQPNTTQLDAINITGWYGYSDYIGEPYESGGYKPVSNDIVRHYIDNKISDPVMGPTGWLQFFDTAELKALGKSRVTPLVDSVLQSPIWLPMKYDSYLVLHDVHIEFNLTGTNGGGVPAFQICVPYSDYYNNYNFMRHVDTAILSTYQTTQGVKINMVDSLLSPAQSFFEMPIFGNFTLANVLEVIIAVSIMLLLLKMFAGG